MTSVLEDGRVQSVDTLARAFHGPMRDFVARRVAAEDVDDVVQAVFLRLAERRDVIDDIEHVSGFIHRVARNAIVDHLRARGRAGARFDLGEPDAFAEREVAELPSDGRALARCLAPIVDTLPEPYRTAIRLTDLEGATHVEASRREGTTLTAMKSRVQRARALLRERVLACCRVELDRRRAVTDFESRRPDCACTPR